MKTMEKPGRLYYFEWMDMCTAWMWVVKDRNMINPFTTTYCLVQNGFVNPRNPNLHFLYLPLSCCMKLNLNIFNYISCKLLICGVMTDYIKEFGFIISIICI